MVRISSPVLDPSAGFIIGTIFFMRISFDSMQSLIPLVPVLNQNPTDTVKEKFITDVPVIFSVIEFCVIIVASILSDTLIRPEHMLRAALLVWPPLSICFSIIESQEIFMLLIRIMATLKGIIEPLILSTGIQIYNLKDLNKIYLYFMATYCAYVAGGMGTQAILKMDVIENNMCGNMSCIDLAWIYATGAGIVGLIIYMQGSTKFEEQNDSENDYIKEICSICRLIVVYIPYIIFWIFYQRIQPQLTFLPLLVDMYPVGVQGMPQLYTIIKLMFAIIYYIFYRFFRYYILKYSVIIMAVGGILIGLWSIIGASMVLEHRDQYLQARPVKPDAIQVTYFCMTDKPVYIDIPYYESPRCDMKGHSNITINRDQILVLRENNLCPYIIFPSNTINQCLSRGNRYVVLMCELGSGMAFQDYAERDRNGKAVVCVTLMKETKCISNVDAVDIVLYKNATENSDARQYPYMLFSSHFNLTTSSRPAWNQYCQPVEPSTYFLRAAGNRVQMEYNFSAGGVYYFMSSITKLGYWNFTSVEPYNSTLTNTPLVFMNTIRAIGEYLLVLNGFFCVFAFIQPTFRTIAIAIWLMMIKFGAMIYEIEYHNDIYFQHGDLNKLGGILIVLPIISLIWQYFCCGELVDKK